MSPETVLITGCSDGSIGGGLARAFAARGLKVIAAARSASSMSALSTQPNISLLELDVRSAESIAAALEKVSVETGGTLDYLVNNAGVAYRVATIEFDDEMARALFDVNFWGVLDMCRAFAPLIVRAKGTIVNISSTMGGGGIPLPWNCKYFQQTTFHLPNQSVKTQPRHPSRTDMSITGAKPYTAPPKLP